MTLVRAGRRLTRMPALSAPAVAPAVAAPAESTAAAICYHCGLPNPPSSRWIAAMTGTPRRFCCAGCLAVAEVIHGAGLESFYATRSAPAVRPEADMADTWTQWDGVAAAAGLVRVDPDGRREASLLLEGITCGACVWLIESWLARQPGVAAASINLATRRAQVAWRDGETSLSCVLRAIATIGYRAHPYDPVASEVAARRERRALLTRMAIALLAMMQVMMFALPQYLSDDGVEPAHASLLNWASLVLTLPAIAYSAWPFFRGAWRDLRIARPGMDVPVALGLATAFGASAWATFAGQGAVYFDSVTMFIALLLVARYVELVARQRAGEAIEAVARACPVTAERIAGGTTTTVAAATLAAGDRVLVRPGASVPADGTVVDGRSQVAQALLTGESWPVPKAEGDIVLAGSLNGDGPLIVKVSAAGDATQLAAIVRLAERAAALRPRAARLADRVAAVFVTALLLLAAITAFVWWRIDPEQALAVTFAVLAVSCPCALSLATPSALAASAGALARRQVVFAQPDALETLSRVTHVVLDKTGTLTEGRPRLVAMTPLGTVRPEVALALAAALEARSEHPLARVLTAAATARPMATHLTNVAGEGVGGIIDGVRFRLGRVAFVAGLAGPAPDTMADFERDAPAGSTVIALGSRGAWVAAFAITDATREGASPLIAQLATLRVTPVLLSGDRALAARVAGAALGIADARGDLGPEDKRAAIAALQAQGAVVAMTGDGVNDAPALAQAQVAISLGTATPLAQSVADVVVLSDDPARIGDAIATARRTFAVIRQNLAWAALYNAIAIPLAAFGFVTPLVAAAGMSASSLVVVFNALRLAR